MLTYLVCSRPYGICPWRVVKHIIDLLPGAEFCFGRELVNHLPRSVQIKGFLVNRNKKMLDMVCENKETQLIYAAKYGIFGAFVWLLGIYFPDRELLLLMNKFFRKQYRTVNFKRILGAAYQSGNTLLIEYIINLGVTNHKYALIGACRGGHITLVQYALHKGASNWNQCFYHAARSNKIELVKVLFSLGATKWNDVLCGGSRCGNREIINYAIANGASDFNGALISAARGGHEKIVDFFLEIGAKEVNVAYEKACRGGHGKLAIKLARIGATNWLTGLSAAIVANSKLLVQFNINRLKNINAEIFDLTVALGRADILLILLSQFDVELKNLIAVAKIYRQKRLESILLNIIKD